MPYATPDDLIARFGERELIDQTDLAGTGAYDPVTVARALEDASGVIDGYVSRRHALPIASVPALLVGVCCDLVRYALYVDAAPDLVQRRRDQAMSTLRDIADGRLRIDVGDEAGAGDAVPSGLAEIVQPGRKVFGGGLR